MPEEWADQVSAGKFDQGWDAVREETFARQKALGVIPPRTRCSPSAAPARIPAWDAMNPPSCTPLLAREMGVFSGYLEYADHHVGRLIDVLADLSPEVAGDIFDRGLIMTGGGASMEGLPTYLTKELGLSARVADDPRFAIVRGLSQLYDEPLLLRRVARTEPHLLMDTEATAFET